MWFLLVGIVLLAMKLGEFGPGANWSWVAVLAPFGLAILWWQFSDSTGLTKRREIQKMDDRKAERRSKSLEALGIDARRERKVSKAKDLARRANVDANPAGESRRRDPPP
jgi:small Trp-rich protein